MAKPEQLTRRSLIALLASAATSTVAGAQVRPSVTIYKEATCGCCGLWARHMTSAGFAVETIDVPNISRIKTQLGVPLRLATCHTAEVGGYLVEGHVPATVVKRLLSERPAGRGLAVPGMPAGSPGMEGGTPETYAVLLFGKAGEQSVYARCREDREI